MNIQVRMITAQAQARVRALEAEIARLNSGLASSGSMAAGFLGARALNPLTKFGNQLQWTGRQLQYNFTLPIVLAGAAATKFALDNERAFTKIVKVYGDATLSAATMRNELVALKKAFVGLSDHYGVHQAEVLEVAAAWAAAGASGVALARSVEQTLKTMVLGEMDAAEATSALIAIQAQYNLSSQELADTIAKLNIIENQTGISLAGLVQGFSRAAGVARSAGIDVDHLGALLAALTPAAGSAAQAGNGLKTIISRLLAPTGEAADLLKELGIQVDATSWKSSNGSQRIELLSTKFHNLDDAQKAVVSSTLASRYQINRFDVLMDSVYKSVDNNVKTTGYYGKALEATANRAAYLAQAERELRVVLESNPQKLKQTWVILENAMADIIIPMIPVILMAANALRALAEGFRSLPPEIQKAITFALLFLALFGPLIRYIGSTITLVMELKWAFSGLALAGISAAKGVGFVAALPFKAIALGFTSVYTSAVQLMIFLSVGMLSMARGFASVFPAIVGGALMPVRAAFLFAKRDILLIWAGTLGGLKLITGPALTAITSAFALWRAGIIGAMALVRTAVVAGWAATLATTRFIVPAMTATVSAMWVGIVAVTRAGAFAMIASIKGMWVIVLASFRAAPRIAIGYVAFMWAGIRTLMIDGIAFLRKASIAIATALTGPWGAALVAAVIILVAFRDQIKQVIENVIDYFNQLPFSIYDAMRAVVDIVKAAALAVYDWFQYINPFAHHSPSLVENVTKGMSAVRAQFNTLDSIRGPINAAYRDITRFSNATAALRNGMDNAKRAEDRANLSKVSPGSLDEFDALVSNIAVLNRVLASLNSAIQTQEARVEAWRNRLDAVNAVLDRARDRLDDLQKRLDSASDSLSEAKDRLNNFANTPIKGMQAMSDKIFANEMAQKRLRLEMLKIEQVTGPIDKLRSKMDKLNGEIEMLTGEQASLRAAGAGSDILKTYDDQVTGLEAQQKAITDTLKPYDDLQKKLEDLARQGEILDLENSLRFDPLTRAIEQTANAMKELPFDQIMKGIRGAKQDIGFWTKEVDSATRAVDNQKKAIDQLEGSRNAIQSQLDSEEAKLSRLRDAYDQVSTAIQDVEAALRDVSQAAEDSIRRQEEAARKAGGVLSPAVENFRNARGGNFPDVSGTGALGREGGPGDQSALIDQFTQDLAKQTGDMLGSFDIFGPIKTKWDQFVAWWKKNVGPSLAPIVDFVKKTFTSVDFGAPFRNLNLQPLKDFGAVVLDIIKTLAGWGKAIFDLFGPTLKDTLDAVVGGVKDMWTQIAPEVVKFKELAQPLAEAFKNLWVIAKPILALIGVAILGVIEIIWSMLNGAIRPVFSMIGGILAGFLTLLRGVIRLVAAVINGDWRQAWTAAGEIIGGIWKIIWSIVSGSVQTVLGLFKGFVQGVVDFFKWLYDQLVGHSIVPDIVNGIFKWIYKLAVLPRWIWDNVLVPWFNNVKNWWDGSLKPKIIGIVNGFISIVKGWGAIPGWIWTYVFLATYNKLVAWYGSYIAPKAVAIRDGFFAILKGWANIANWLWTNAFMPIYNKLSSLWNSYLRPLGNRMITGFANIFNTVGRAIVNGINIGIGAVNKLIDGLNWIGSHVPGLSFSVGKLGTAVYAPWKAPQFARGGSLPMSEVGNGFKTNGVRAIVGEGNPSHPEFVIPTDPKYRNRAMSLLTQAAREVGVGTFEDGGILGKIKNAVMKGGELLQRGAVNAVFRPINAAVGATLSRMDDRMYLRSLVQFGVKAVQNWASGVNKSTDEAMDSVGTGGGRVNGGLANALKWAQSQEGKPYIWGSAGPNGYDCSGFMGAITNYIRNQNPYHRIGSTGTFPWGGFAPGWGAFSIGSFRGNPGHMAGTLNGINVESAGGGIGVRVGPEARGAGASLFGGNIWHLKGFARGGILGSGGDPAWDLLSPNGSAFLGQAFRRAVLHGTFDKGGFLSGGLNLVKNGTGGPEPVLTKTQWSTMLHLAEASSAVGAMLPRVLKSASPGSMATATGRASVRLGAYEARQGSVLNPGGSSARELHFHGDLSFPNIKSGDDAEKFVNNLEILARGA